MQTKLKTALAGRNILLVDDDPIFRASMTQYARKLNIPLTICTSLRDLCTKALPKVFEVAIIDYYLDGMKDYLTGTEVATVLEETPIILVSSSDRCLSDSQNWPSSIKKFLNKKSGVQTILTTALELKSTKNSRETLKR